ncbi:MAG TPA: hypothetical protein ENK05_03775 [Gammaproteobacteria bacterium]|nr:hypothetical protein [Gammaproteobacteria bacterium]
MPKGKRRGQHSIRVDDQWRVCFVWSGANAHDVEIVGYHKDEPMRLYPISILARCCWKSF